MFGRATITFGIGPHSSFVLYRIVSYRVHRTLTEAKPVMLFRTRRYFVRTSRPTLLSATHSLRLTMSQWFLLPPLLDQMDDFNYVVGIIRCQLIYIAKRRGFKQKIQDGGSRHVELHWKYIVMCAVNGALISYASIYHAVLVQVSQAIPETWTCLFSPNWRPPPSWIMKDGVGLTITTNVIVHKRSSKLTELKQNATKSEASTRLVYNYVNN